MTRRLYYHDSYLRDFRARVVERHGDSVYLDQTAFYPTSGGQPFDTGTLGGATVVEVIDEETRIAHRISGELNGVEAEGAIDWTRRFDHMQQHTGQHLLSAVLQETLGIPTVSFHLGQDVCTIDVAAAQLTAKQLAALEEKANQVIWENRAVTVSFHDSQDEIGLRKASDRGGELRVVTIEGLDRSACGGTHVRATGEIGLVLLGKLDKVRGNVRIEFVCGGRAVRQARAAEGSLASRLETQAQRLADAEKLARKLGAELAGYRGRQLHAALTPNAKGLRVEFRTVESIGDDLRAEAQSFIACGKAVMMIAAASSSAAMLAVSKDSGFSAGDAIKPLLAQFEGRGGGNEQIAQGTIGNPARFDQFIVELRNLFEA
jgi:alanyl-tRNA synthetase